MANKVLLQLNSYVALIKDVEDFPSSHYDLVLNVVRALQGLGYDKETLQTFFADALNDIMPD